MATIILSPDETSARLSLSFGGLSSAQTDAHIHGPAAPGVAAPPIVSLPSGQISDLEVTLTPSQVQSLKDGLLYVNVHTSMFPNGEIRGQFLSNPSSSVLTFGATNLGATEGEGSVDITVTRVGNTSGTATVDYATSDGAGSNGCDVINSIASSRCDYSPAFGRLEFAAGETSKTISIPIVNDAYAEGTENFTLGLSNSAGANLGPPTTVNVTINDNENTNGVNPVNDAEFFVRQHYIDFLNREPDVTGFPFWINEITSCGMDPTCIELKRINVSAAFFLSIEFQQTGFLVYRMYKTGYDDLPALPVPVRLNEFLPDTQQIGRGVIVGQAGWEQQLENNKRDFVADFVGRRRFTDAHPTTLTPTEFVDRLFANAGVIPSPGERQAAIDQFGGAATSSDAAARARVLRTIAEHPALAQAEFNKAFVLMQYFGYLRRNPNDFPESTLDFQGFNFWLGKLNQFNGNFLNAEMVKAFLVSGEYKGRFGP